MLFLLGKLLQKGGKASKQESCMCASGLLYNCWAQVRILAQDPNSGRQDMQEIWAHSIHLFGI